VEALDVGGKEAALAIAKKAALNIVLKASLTLF